MSSIKEKMIEFDNALYKRLSQYGFSRKRKYQYVRKVDVCQQHVSIQDTKIKGEEKVHIFISVGFKYEEINRIIAYLKGEKYDNKWPTGSINVDSLIDSKKIYSFYIESHTDVNPIINSIISVLEKYAFPFLETCNSLEKFENMLICKNKEVVSSTIGLDKPEWNLLALSIVLEHISVDEVVKEYENDFMSKPVQWEMTKTRIERYDKIKEKI